MSNSTGKTAEGVGQQFPRHEMPEFCIIIAP